MTQSGRNLKPDILALLGERDYRPLDKIEIARKLKLGSNERVALRKTLRELEHSGEIARIRKNRYVLPAEADLVTGTISIHQAGYAFLNTETPGQPDVFVAPENTGTAMHGDRVVVRISRDKAPPRGKGPEGRIIRILERARDTTVGTLQHTRNFYYVVPDDPRFVHNVYVQVPPRAKLTKAPVPGDKVVVRLEPWESRHVNPEGEIIEVLGPASAPGVDVLSIIRKYDLPTEFPKEVIDEVGRIPKRVETGMIEGREDLRKNSSSRSIPMMRAISTTPSTSKRSMIKAGGSVCTSRTWQPTCNLAARSIAKRAGAETAFICPTASFRCCPSN